MVCSSFRIFRSIVCKFIGSSHPVLTYALEEQESPKPACTARVSAPSEGRALTASYGLGRSRVNASFVRAGTRFRASVSLVGPQLVAILPCAAAVPCGLVVFG